MSEQTIIITQFSGTAAASAAAAEVSKTAAQLAESNAELAETNAEAAEVLAEKWAENPEDVAVETGKYSAKHHALKASASKDAAQTAETNAEKWAANPEDTEVETGKYSALHYAAKADESKTAAENLYGDLTAVENAKNDAITAKNDAVTAKNDSVTAKNDSVSAKNAAQAAQLAAEIAAASSGAAGSESDAIQLLRLHNPDLVFSGFVNTSTSTPSHTANKAYVASSSGTVLGLTVTKGQIIKDTGSAFVAESMNLQLDVYDVTVRVPLASGYYYQMTNVSSVDSGSLPTFAPMAVPLSLRINGLKIQFKSSLNQTEVWQYNAPAGGYTDARYNFPFYWTKLTNKYDMIKLQTKSNHIRISEYEGLFKNCSLSSESIYQDVSSNYDYIFVPVKYGSVIVITGMNNTGKAFVKFRGYSDMPSSSSYIGADDSSNDVIATRTFSGTTGTFTINGSAANIANVKYVIIQLYTQAGVYPWNYDNMNMVITPSDNFRNANLAELITERDRITVLEGFGLKSALTNSLSHNKHIKELYLTGINTTTVYVIGTLRYVRDTQFQILIYSYNGSTYTLVASNNTLGVANGCNKNIQQITAEGGSGITGYVVVDFEGITSQLLSTYATLVNNRISSLTENNGIRAILEGKTWDADINTVSLIPDKFFTLDYNANTENYIQKVFPESFALAKFENAKLNGFREAIIDDNSVYAANSSATEIKSKTLKLKADNYSNVASKAISIYRSKIQNAQNKDIRLLMLGDSIPQLGITTGMNVIAAKHNADLGNISIKCVGTMDESTSIVYKGNTIPIRSFDESRGGWSAANFLRHVDALVSSNAASAWDMLGLGTLGSTRTYVAYIGTAEQKALIASTCNGYYAADATQTLWNFFKARYPSGFTYGGTTYTWAASWNSGTESPKVIAAELYYEEHPSNPFYDKAMVVSTSGSYAFSIGKYLEKYRTLLDDGITRATTTKGTAVTDVNAYDVCTPNYIIIDLGANDFTPAIGYANVQLFQTVVNDYNAAHSLSIRTAFFNVRPLGVFTPDMWADKGRIIKWDPLTTDAKIALQALLCSSSFTSTHDYIPAYCCESVLSQQVKAVDLSDGAEIYFDKRDGTHPATYGDEDTWIYVLPMAYQILSWLYYKLSI